MNLRKVFPKPQICSDADEAATQCLVMLAANALQGKIDFKNLVSSIPPNFAEMDTELLMLQFQDQIPKHLLENSCRFQCGVKPVDVIKPLLLQLAKIYDFFKGDFDTNADMKGFYQKLTKGFTISLWSHFDARMPVLPKLG